jgi:two-component system, sporulation sensor kinase E
MCRTLPIGLAYCDQDLKFIYVNDFMANLNGRPAEEHVSRAFREMMPPAMADYAEPAMRKVLETGEALVDWEVSLPDRNQKIRDWLIQYHPALEGGKVVGVHAIVQEITEHRQMDRVLQATEELFRETFEQTSVGIAHVGLDGRWLRVNRRVCEITGYQAEELARLTYHDLTHPEDQELENQLGYANLIAGKVQRYSLEKRCIRKDGRIAWTYVKGSLMRDAAGKPLYVIAVIEDITARKQAEEELAEGKERLQAALDASTTGTFRWDIHSNNLGSDRNLDRLFGLSAEQTIGSLDRFIAMIHPDDRPGVVFRCEQCATRGADFEMEFRVIWPDDSVHWLYDRGKTFLDDDDRPEYMTGACVDVTERKAAQKALEISEERLRLALESGGSGTFEWDLVNGASLWSKELEKLHGFAPGGFSGSYESWRECLHPDDLPHAEEAFAEATKTGHFITEWRILRRDTGEIRWMAARGSVLYDNHHKPVRMLGINVDVTERKRAESALRVSEKLAATGRLASTLAHEINNPLAAVTNLIYLLRSNPALDDLAAQQLAMADSEIRRVSQITRKLLSFHREPTQPVPVDLSAILEEVAELYRPRLMEKKLQVRLDRRNVQPITAYPGEMRQIFANLVGNAMEATPEGGRLSLRVKSGGPQMVRVLVADSGPGIPRENIARIFEPFFTTKGEKGTGLGLWITRDLVTKHGGQIRVRSNKRGTCFIVNLPVQPHATAP